MLWQITDLEMEDGWRKGVELECLDQLLCQQYLPFITIHPTVTCLGVVSGEILNQWIPGMLPDFAELDSVFKVCAGHTVVRALL